MILNAESQPTDEMRVSKESADYIQPSLEYLEKRFSDIDKQLDQLSERDASLKNLLENFKQSRTEENKNAILDYLDPSKEKGNEVQIALVNLALSRYVKNPSVDANSSQSLS